MIDIIEFNGVLIRFSEEESRASDFQGHKQPRGNKHHKESNEAQYQDNTVHLQRLSSERAFG